jgi:hypothetical protein
MQQKHHLIVTVAEDNENGPICYSDEIGSSAMTDRKTAQPAQMVEAVRAAQRTLNDALETAKQLKAKSRDAKRRMKAAKKASKQASRDARASRKAAEQARHLYKKAVARTSTARAKAAKTAKKEEKIVTPKRTSPSRNHTPSRKRTNRDGGRARRRAWEVAEDGTDAGSAATEPETETGTVS